MEAWRKARNQSRHWQLRTGEMLSDNRHGAERNEMLVIQRNLIPTKASGRLPSVQGKTLSKWQITENKAEERGSSPHPFLRCHI